MPTTTWIAGSGDWNTASNWSAGVPTAADDAVFDTGLASDTISGNGPAASLTLLPGVGATLTLTGTHALDSFTELGSGAVALSGVAALSFATGSVSGTQGGQARLLLAAGASLGTGTLTLASTGTLSGALGTLSNPIVVPDAGIVPGSGVGAGTADIAGYGTLVGAVSGPGLLAVGPSVGTPGRLVLAGDASAHTGGTIIDAGYSTSTPQAAYASAVEASSTAALGVGPLFADLGPVLLDPGVRPGAIEAGPEFFLGTVVASDQDLLLYAGPLETTLRNGSGHATVIGAVNPDQYTGVASHFGSLSVSGGTGSVTVWGGNEGGAIYGGTAGNNVLVGGAALAGYTVSNPNILLGPGGTLLNNPGGMTIGGGGNGDLLVASGTLNNVLAAATGNETLTGSGSTGDNLFHGGTGADVIVAGAGRSTIVAGSGSATISGGSGTATIFAGTGQDVILGGAGADYVQAGAGNATLFAGSGMDLVGAVAGLSGGSLTVSGFRVGTDLLALQGYGGSGTMAGITDSRVTGGSTILTLADATRITLLAVSSLGSTSFA